MNTSRVIPNLVALNLVLGLACVGLTIAVVTLVVRDTPEPEPSRTAVFGVSPTASQVSAIPPARRAVASSPLGPGATTPRAPVPAVRNANIPAAPIASVFDTAPPASPDPAGATASVVPNPGTVATRVTNRPSQSAGNSNLGPQENSRSPSASAGSTNSGLLFASGGNLVAGGGAGLPSGTTSSAGEGLPATDRQIASAGATDEPAAAITVPDGTTSVPASLEVTSDELNLSAADRREKRRLAEDFARTVTEETTGDPTDPTYRNQYLRAARNNDDLFRVYFGQDAFMAQQRKSHEEAAKLLLESAAQP